MPDLPKGLVNNEYNKELFSEILSMTDGEHARRHYETQNFSIHVFVNGLFKWDPFDRSSGWEKSDDEMLITLIDKKTGRLSSEIYSRYLSHTTGHGESVISILERGDEVSLFRKIPTLIGNLTCFERPSREGESIKPTVGNLMGALSLDENKASDSDLEALLSLAGTRLDHLDQWPNEIRHAQSTVNMDSLAASRAREMTPRNILSYVKREWLSWKVQISLEPANDFSPPAFEWGVFPKLQASLGKDKPTSLLRLENELSERRQVAIDDYLRDTVKESISRALMAKSGDPECLSRPEVANYLDRAVTVGAENTLIANFLGNQTPMAFRNKIQVMDLVDHSLGGWSLLMNETPINECLESGSSLKDTLADNYAMANTSKASMKRFFNNVAAIGAGRQGYRKDREYQVLGGNYAKFLYPQKIEGLSEKGESLNLDRLMHEKTLPTIDMAAILATFPIKKIMPESIEAVEAGYPLGPARVRDLGILSNLIQHDGGVESMRRSARLHRSGDASFDETLGWLSRDDVRKNNEIMTQWYDGASILSEVLQGSIESHLLHGMGHTGSFRSRPERSFDRRNMAQRLASTMNMSQALDICERAHQVQQRVMAAGQASANVVWEPAIQAPFQQGEWSIEPLHSVVDLHREGKALNHCVGTYSHAAMQGETFIFGVRNNDQPVSTLELSGESMGGYRVIQHRGLHNGEPPEAAKAIESAFISRLDSFDIEINTNTGIQDNAAWEALTHVEKHEIESGIAFTDREAIHAIFKEIRDIDPHGQLINFERFEKKHGERFSHELDRLKAEVGFGKDEPVPGDA